MRNKVIYALLSVLIAFGLWFYVITVVSPESEATYYNIPVVLNNESVMNDKGLMIATEKEPTVTLRLRGNRSDLNNLKNSDITLIVDLAKINDPGEQHLYYTITYPGNFASNAFEVLSQSPDKITLDIVEWGTKDVDVTVAYAGSVPPDYIVDKEEVVLDYEKVTITGPKEVIDRITQARIDINLNNQMETISQSYRYTLCDAAGEPVDAAQVLTNVAEVSATVKIQRVKELQLKVDVTYGGGATEQNTSIVLSQQTIKVSGSEKLLAGLGDTLTLGAVDVSEMLTDDVLTFPINLPEGVENLAGLAEVVVTINFQELDTIMLPVSNIQEHSVPEGMVVTDIGTKVCMVTLRGPAAQIRAITEEDIAIRVDLTNAELGEGLYKAQIVITNPDYDDVGIVGTYNIVIKLAEKE